MLIEIRKGWHIPEREATPESVALNRRQILAAAGFLGLAGLVRAATEGQSLYPAKRNPEFTLDRAVTPEWAATGYNNFYEFNAEDKEAVRNEVGKFVIHPWQIQIAGLVNKPKTLDFDDLVRQFPLEERLYRLRCVEAWSMAIPWTGFPLSQLIKFADPKPEAKYVRFVTVKRPKEMPGINRESWYPWPYTEGLRMDEAMNSLSFV
ncbi:MAG: protein-methionine-sulfoxide reductase catalytic subunit MsrP, partial [Bryobacteraceae bacterium]